MKRKYNSMALATLSVCIFALPVHSGNCAAQDLSTSSAQQAKIYGQWSPPAAQPQNSPSLDETRDRFNSLFPAANQSNQLKPIDNQSTGNRIASSYPLSKKPAPLLNEPRNARSLQPSGQGDFLQGTFIQEAKSGGDFARVNHHEASTAEAALPLPNPNRLTAWPSDAPSLDRSTSMTTESLTGMVGSMQTSSKELWNQFQAKGGWGERITSFFGGGEDGKIKRVFGSLAVVIGGYLAFVALLRKFKLTGNRGIPSEVIEVIGSAPFGPRKNLQLVRLGSKLLLLMNSPDGTHPVGEITDAEEVDYLISLCKGRGSKANRSVMSAVKRMTQRTNNTTHSSGRILHPTPPVASEATFSTSQLVQALESLNGNRSATVYEA